MTTRRALIIGAPDPDIPGVELDVANYRRFLLSPLGGSWKPEEVITLNSPSKMEVSVQLKALAGVSYSVTIFAGHGRHLVPPGTTIVKLQKSVEMDSLELRRGAEKHTLILDCCRKPSTRPVMEALMAKAAKQELSLNPDGCRRAFDYRIDQCGRGLVVLFACSVDEYANESEEGGYYSSSLVRAANEWMGERAASADLKTSYYVLSVTDAHEKAAQRVKGLSGGRQNPISEYPRTTPRFPFAVLA